VPTAEQIHGAALARWQTWDRVVPYAPPEVEPEVAERIGREYGGIPAHDGPIPTAVARIVHALFPTWGWARKQALVMGVVGCGTLTAHSALDRAARPTGGMRRHD
jgi:hypothetical protein